MPMIEPSRRHGPFDWRWSTADEDGLRKRHEQVVLEPVQPHDSTPEPAVRVDERTNGGSPAAYLGAEAVQTKTLPEQGAIGGHRQRIRQLVDEAVRARFAARDGLCPCGCGAITRDGRLFKLKAAQTPLPSV